jgi:hypothetical protein
MNAGYRGEVIGAPRWAHGTLPKRASRRSFDSEWEPPAELGHERLVEHNLMSVGAEGNAPGPYEVKQICIKIASTIPGLRTLCGEMSSLGPARDECDALLK